MWRAERDSTTARTDEDRAMAHVCYGFMCIERDEARDILISGIKDEIRRHLDGPSAYFSAFSVSRLSQVLEHLIQESDLNEVECDGLRFRIAEWGNKN